ncbi:hypothetical protein DFH07DRAFT_972098 [Mycena maculata]|uniref:Uncharacterized protein n=1 Tax=Mycena maculata TaxID=230809 RepID=A0AAD7HJC9_9AGAR|nr:hypothetical protein DFH07DRAFT_972098 [Mycena maculata]
MFTKILSITLFFPLIRAAATIDPGSYLLVNLANPYAPASFDSKNRVFLPQPFSGNYDLGRTFSRSPFSDFLTFRFQWQVVTPSERTDGITIQNLRGKKYAKISPPAEGQFVSTGNNATAFSTVLSGTADFPGDGELIPDTHLDYWTASASLPVIATPTGLVWTYDGSVGPEISLRPLNANRTAGQYWMFAAEGSLPILPRDLEEEATLSPRLVFPS